MMCNHKRTIPKTYELTLQKKRDTLKKVEKEQVWKKTQEILKKVESTESKTDTQKKSKT
jgi:DNA topoisomerase-1